MESSSTKILKAAVLLLLITNIALIAFFVFGKDNKQPSRENGKAAHEKMMKEMNMTEAQKKQYDSLREYHFSAIRPLFDSIRMTRQALFNLMKEDSLNDSLVTVYSNRISEKQNLADRQTLLHFRQVRALFSQEQQQKFDAIVQKMMQRGKKDTTGKTK